MKKTLLCVALILFGISLSALSLNYPVVQVNGKSYYSYTVEPKDGLFGISKKFGVSQADLHAHNPNLGTGLTIGQVILVPIVGPVAKQNPSNTFITHEVLPKETFYSLSRQYDVSIEEIKAHNPATESGLQIGMVLKIPVKQSGKTQITPTEVAATTDVKVPNSGEKSAAETRKHIVQRKETLYKISRDYGVSVEELTSANNITSLTVGQELIIPDSKKSEQPDSQLEEFSPKVVESPIMGIKKNDLELLNAYQPVKNAPQNPNALRIAVLLPFMLETPYIDASVNYFWDFYRGILIGLNEVKKSGISVDLYTFDIEKNPRTLDSILNLPSLKTMDLIIGPAYSNQVSVVSKFSRDNHIYMVVPFTSRIEESDSHEYMLQFNPSQDVLLPLVAQTMVDRFASSNFVIARFTSKQDKANALADEVIKALVAKRKPYREIQLSTENVDTLRTLIGQNRSLLVMATTRLDVVSTLLPEIEALKLPFLQIWGFEDWKQWVNFHEGTYYYSLFRKNNLTVYQSSYKKWYGELSPKNIPMYDLIGYDLITYTTKALKTKQKNMPSAFGIIDCELLQSEFKFQKLKSSNHWVNMSWSLFGYYNEKTSEIK